MTKETRFVGLGSLKKKSYVLIDDVPCEVVDISISKPGKHQSAKARVVAIGVFDGKRREIMGPADSQVLQPVIVTKTGIVTFVSDDTAQVMDNETYETVDVIIPDEFKGVIKEGDSVKYQEWGEFRKITQRFSE